MANYISVIEPLIAHNVLVRNHDIGKKIAKKSGDIGVIEQVTTGLIVEESEGFDVLARDSFVQGALSEDGKYQSRLLSWNVGALNSSNDLTLKPTPNPFPIREGESSNYRFKNKSTLS